MPEPDTRPWGEGVDSKAGSDFYRNELNPTPPEPEAEPEAAPAPDLDAGRVTDGPVAWGAAHHEAPIHDERLKDLDKADKAARTLDNQAATQRVARNPINAQQKRDEAAAIREQALAASEARKVIANESSTEFIKGVHEAERADKEASYEANEGIAWEAAHAETGLRAVARSVESHDGVATSEQSSLAASLRAEAAAEGERAGEVERTAQDAAEAAREKAAADAKEAKELADAQYNERFVGASKAVLNLKAVEKGGIPSIDARMDRPTTQRLIDQLYETMRVDTTKEPFKTETKGSRVRGQRTVNIMRESTDPAYRGMVFVERHDWATGKLLYLDVVKAPKAADADAKDLKKWSKAIKSQLSMTRLAHHRPHKARVGERLTGHHDDVDDGAAAAILRRSGYDTPRAPAPPPRPPRRRSRWWQGGSGS